MIAIDTEIFDFDVIQEIYSDEEFLSELESMIEKAMKENTHIVVKELFRKWFYDEKDILAREKVKRFLLDNNPEKYIEMFYQKEAEKIEGNIDCYKVLKVWPGPLKNAMDEKVYRQRKTIITDVITPENLDMFTGITKLDLNVKPKKKTLWSNKERLRKIKLRHKDEYDALKKDFVKVFDYDTFAKRFRAKLLGAMKVDVCPYCNRQFITMFDDNGQSKATADIDHFYCKDIYPFLALSLYNFIPSCQICNSRFKLAKDFYKVPHINPYRRGFLDDCIFQIKSLDGLINEENLQYGLINSTGDEAINNSVNTFHLNEVYQSHKEYVKELVRKSKIYNESQLTEYLRNFQELFKSQEELIELLYGSYFDLEKLSLRPLSKLTRDILKDIGVEL